MASSFVVYIDESGDEGFRFGGGSSEWFVLSAVITRRTTDLDTVKLVDEVRADLNKPPRKPLHFKDLRHEQRLPYVSRIAAAHLKTVSVLVHKPSLPEPEELQERYMLYFHTTRHLLERVSWYCRDHRHGSDEGDGTAEIVFSNRSGMSYGELCGYLEHLRQNSGPLNIHIDWSVVRESQVSSLSPGRRMGLQIADAIAGSFFYSVEQSRYGFSEPRYAQMLKPVVYRGRNGWLGYGLKFWPEDAVGLATEERYRWIGEAYQ